jgi:2-keto-4-pentenoate hydratase/2-oxohepta-3-ene-1,7-dioic acid hydratase in catechol pathway
MRIVRFMVDGETDETNARFGVVGNRISDGARGNGADASAEGPVVAELAGHPLGAVESIRLTGTSYLLDDVRLLIPVVPRKIVAIGRNYAAHIQEMGNEVPAEPVLFLKPPTALCHPGDAIERPADLSQRVDFEGELAVVIGKPARRITPDQAAGAIFGYTCANDVTARDLQARDGQWARAKGFDTFCPLGPWIETDLDPADLEITTTVNGEKRQNSRTSLLLHNVPALVSFVSSAMTLLPGDVLLTGTPEGVGPLEPGDEVSVTIEDLGTLTNPVVDRA